jgi:putative transposase
LSVQATRYLLRREALSTTRERYAFTVFEQVFKEFGLPATMRTDDGVPLDAIRLRRC